MEKHFKLNIQTPCNKNFKDFNPTDLGGICQSCDKEVVDFTKMNTDQIASYFGSKVTNKTCGRFKSNQLTTYTNVHPKQRLGFWSKIGIACLSVLTFNTVVAQEIKPKTNNTETKTEIATTEKSFIVKGTVSEFNLPIPGVNIVLENSTIGTTTDFDGYFEFPIKLKKGDVLVFSMLGMETQKIAISDKESANQVVMQVDMDMTEIILMGEACVEGVFSSKRSKQ